MTEITLINIRQHAGLVSRCGQCNAWARSFCGTLDADEHQALEAISHERIYAANETIFAEGDPATSCFNIVEGAVRLVRIAGDGKRTITGFSFTGSLIGLSPRDTYPYFAEAVGPTRVCHFRTSALRTVFDDYPQLERKLLEITTNELIAAHDQMVLLGRNLAQEKLAGFILSSERKQVQCGDHDNTVNLPMTRRDIADFLGLTVETVSRCFTAFEKQGLIHSLNKRSIQILNRTALEELTFSGSSGT